MTCIEFKFKISYGAFGEIHFQTATRLSLKKRKKKRSAKTYKKKQTLIHETKEKKNQKL